MNKKQEKFIPYNSSEIFDKKKEYDFNTISRAFLDAKRGREDMVVLEGVQVFKHSLRFGAKFIFVFIKNKKENIEKLKKVIPDEVKKLEEISVEIPEEDFEKLSSHKITTDILILAKKVEQKDLIELNKDKIKKPIVFLEDAADLGNIGSALRASAAFGAQAFITSGKSSLWHQKTIKSATGLNYAIPIYEVKNFEELKEKLDDRVFVTADDKGENIKDTIIPNNSVIVFGTERAGVKESTKKACSKIISLPMMPKISSLNLATSVSAFLYGAKFK